MRSLAQAKEIGDLCIPNRGGQVSQVSEDWVARSNRYTWVNHMLFTVVQSSNMRRGKLELESIVTSFKVEVDDKRRFLKASQNSAERFSMTGRQLPRDQKSVKYGPTAPTDQYLRKEPYSLSNRSTRTPSSFLYLE